MLAVAASHIHHTAVAGHYTPPATGSPQSHRAELADFAARACHTLWHGAGMVNSGSEFSPRTLFYSTPESFRMLVRRTLHPHLSAHTATVALLYVQRYINAQLSQCSLNDMGLPTPSFTSPCEYVVCDAEVRPGPGSEARIWCTALSLAIKEHDDRAAAARAWAPARVEEAAGGMTALELVAMEKEFLEGIDWRLRITPEEYAGWLQRLRKFKAVMELSTPMKVNYNLNRSSSSPSPSECSKNGCPIDGDRKRSIDAAGFDRSKNVMSVANLIDQSPTATVLPPRKKSITAADMADRSFQNKTMPTLTIVHSSPSEGWSSPESSDASSFSSEE